MIEKYPLLEEKGKTMFVFARNGKIYGHIVRDRTDKSLAKFLFETPLFESIDALKVEFPAGE